GEFFIDDYSIHAGHLFFVVGEFAEILSRQERTIVAVREIAAALQGNVHRLEIIRSYQTGFHQGRLIARRRGPAVNGERSLPAIVTQRQRSEERRVGKECRSRWSPEC